MHKKVAIVGIDGAGTYLCDFAEQDQNGFWVTGNQALPLYANNLKDATTEVQNCFGYPAKAIVWGTPYGGTVMPSA